MNFRYWWICLIQTQKDMFTYQVKDLFGLILYFILQETLGVERHILLRDYHKPRSASNLGKKWGGFFSSSSFLYLAKYCIFVHRILDEDMNAFGEILPKDFRFLNIDMNVLPKTSSPFQGQRLWFRQFTKGDFEDNWEKLRRFFWGKGGRYNDYSKVCVICIL